MALFRILHASDLHFNSLRGWRAVAGSPARALLLSRHDPAAVHALARRSWELRHDIDAVLVTGDLATYGDSADLELAREFLLAPAASGWLTASRRATLGFLSPLGVTVAAMPGNHDRYRYGGAALLPGGKQFERWFPTWPVPFGAAPLLDLSAGGERLVVIGLDFTLRHATSATLRGKNWIGTGSADQRTVNAGLGLSALLRSEGACVVWASHFPPGAPARLRLLHEDNLIEGALRAGVPLVLCGHTHRSGMTYRGDRRGNVQFWTAASASEAGNAARAFSLIDFEVDGAVLRSSSLRMVPWNQSRGSFGP